MMARRYEVHRMGKIQRGETLFGIVGQKNAITRCDGQFHQT